MTIFSIDLPNLCISLELQNMETVDGIKTESVKSVLQRFPAA